MNLKRIPYLDFIVCALCRRGLLCRRSRGCRGYLELRSRGLDSVRDCDRYEDSCNEKDKQLQQLQSILEKFE